MQQADQQNVKTPQTIQTCTINLFNILLITFRDSRPIKVLANAKLLFNWNRSGYSGGF